MQKRRPFADSFHAFATRASVWVGNKWAFVLALTAVLVWAVLGPHFHYSDTWQLVVNTTTTIVTFLMVFLIQNTQNRDAAAMHLKLDELIRAVGTARNQLLSLEELSEEELESLEKEFRELQGRYMIALGSLGESTGSKVADRHKTIYQQDSGMTEQRAIQEAAKALSALWKLITPAKP